jgi:hypothetical protein
MMRQLLAEVGYRVCTLRYIRSGTAPSQPRLKRLVKQLLHLSGLSGVRLLAPGYVIGAVKD